MKASQIKGLNHLAAIISFLLISLAYYSPVLEGKKVRSNDDIQYLGMSKEIRDFREEHNKEPYWTNSAFGGMPAYQVSRNYKGDIFKFIDRSILKVPKPAQYLFMTLAGFYLMLLLFGVNWRLSSIGAIAFGLSSYFLIIIAAGHNSKAAAIAYMAPMIGGVYYAYRNKLLPGLIVFALSFGLQLTVNHVQITYYTFLAILIMVAFLLYEDIKSKALKSFIKVSVSLVVVGVVVIGTSFPNLYFSYDYGKYSNRGKSEITLASENNTETGLNKDYALMWSYGIDETLTFLIPNIKGGSSAGQLPENSETYRLFERAQGKKYAKEVIKNAPTYWGTQPSTSGPVYLGATIIFLFVLGLFTYKKRLKWWLLIVTVLSVMLAWGKNFEWFSHLFLDYFPVYNKFRTVTMILVLAQLCIPFLAFLGLNEVLKNKIPKADLIKYLKYSLYIVGGICVIFILFAGSMYSFEASSDAYYLNRQGGDQLVSAFQADRLLILRNDAIRSLVFVLLTALIVYLLFVKKIKNTTALYVAMGLLVLVDLWGVDKRYMNNDYFVTERAHKEPVKPSQADNYILKDTDDDYRVLNLSLSPFSDATTSYFHKSLGGYHAAKMKRYQNFVDFEISKNINDLAQGFQTPDRLDSVLYRLNGINMLNTKYVIYNKDRAPLLNEQRMGAAWVVDRAVMVQNADDELLKTQSEDLRKTAVINENHFSNIGTFEKDSTAVVKMDSYLANHVVYSSNSEKEILTVFSQIYYKDWNAYIDGEPVEHFRANFLLRGLVIPAGNHKIEFKFEPAMLGKVHTVAYASSALIGLLILSGIFMAYRNRKKDETIKE